jgi:hypothetical protein
MIDFNFQSMSPKSKYPRVHNISSSDEDEEAPAAASLQKFIDQVNLESLFKVS